MIKYIPIPAYLSFSQNVFLFLGKKIVIESSKTNEG